MRRRKILDYCLHKGDHDLRDKSPEQIEQMEKKNGEIMRDYKDYLKNQKERLKEIYPENNLHNLDMHDPKWYFLNMRAQSRKEVNK